MKKLSIIIPARNEAKRIIPTLKAYYLYYLKSGLDFEIIIVCNDCQDNTLDICRDFISKGHPKAKVFYFSEKIGKGGAIKEGFKRATGNPILFVDADNSTTPEESMKLVKVIA